MSGTLPPALWFMTPEQTKVYYERKDADRLAKAYAPAPDPDRAVSKGRAETLRAEWQATAAKWLQRADWPTAEGWAETFAPEHPEWFEVDAT